MDKCGIICEYNPFHNGHKYHIDMTKKLLDCDIVCIMSGDFTQRCSPAVFDKYHRAKAAILNGVSAVVELPALYSTAVAEYFAYGAIKILSSIAGLKYLSFGVETDDTDLLFLISDIQLLKSNSLKEKLLSLSKVGLSYPNCLAKATASELSKKSANFFNDNQKAHSFVAKTYSEQDILNVLSLPNNVLAIEYLKAIKRLNVDIKPIFIKRSDGGFKSSSLTPPFASANAVRMLVFSGSDYSNFVPYNFGLSPLNYDLYQAILHFNLLNKQIDLDEGLGIRLKNAAKRSSTLQQAIECCKTKRYTYSRINRLILNTVSDVNKQFLTNKNDFKYKLLAVSNNYKTSLKDFNQNLITSFDKNHFSFLNDYAQKKDALTHAENVLIVDKKLSDLYSIVTKQSCDRFFSKLLII